MKWLKNENGEFAATAQIMNDSLVLSLPNATSPVVWRMDLNEHKATAFEIREEESEFILYMKTPKGEKQDIAAFTEKDAALSALMAASQALAKPQTASATASSQAAPNIANSNYPQNQSKGGIGQVIAAVIGVFIIIFLVVALVKVGPRVPANYASYNEGGTASAGGASGSTQNQPTDTGVPVSADAFLLNR